jgi:phosphoribosylanthranilate isomerase
MMADLKELKIKVCGMTTLSNVKEICALSPDYLGYIFYSKSVRYVGEDPNPEIFSTVPDSIVKTAVFVNEYYERMIEAIEKFGISAVQLHGMESPEMCRLLKSKGLTVIKVIPGDQLGNEMLLNNYMQEVDYFLFDTPISSYGGSGRKFDWSKLVKLKSSVPYFLSGGIGIEDADKLKSLESPGIYALDINSRFESEPGIKNPVMVKKFINEIRNGK